MTEEGTGAGRSPALTVVGVVAVVIGAALLVAGILTLFGDDDSDPATATSSGSSPPTAAPPAAGRDPLPGFGEIALAVMGRSGGTDEYCVLLAATDDQRRRGLMEVTDPELGGYDGMLFDYGEAHEGAFWMRNTPQPLSIAFADVDGEVFETFDMEPCQDSPDCPSYPASAEFRYALEVPRGRLDDLGVEVGSTLDPGGACAPVPGSG